MNKNLPFALITLIAVGCAAIPTQTEVPSSNPANIHAAEAPFPGAVPLLMSGENYAMSPEADKQPMSTDMHKDHQHGQKPASPQEPQHNHQHQHDNPPKQ